MNTQNKNIFTFRKLILVVAVALCPSAAFANQNSPEMIILGSLGMLVLCGLVVLYASHADDAAVDPDNLSFADQETLASKLQGLIPDGGIYSLAVVRQSGNVERIVESLTLRASPIYGTVFD